jgi:hypothetical protein
VPAADSRDDLSAREALLRQAHAVLQESKPRADRVASSRQLSLSTEPRRRSDELHERMRTVFGATFLALPRFKNDATAARNLSGALDASATVLGNDPLAVQTWFIRAERVRSGLARLAVPLRAAEILRLGVRLEPRVAQLPFSSGERWVGLAPLSGAIPSGKLSLVVQAQESLDTTEFMRSIWVDEWVEEVPAREETTAIAFQFNPPDACAPQNVLIAVPAEPAKPWTGAGLFRVLAETLDLAKLRGLDLENLDELSHYLPALFFAFNAQDDAVSTDFAPLTRDRRL